MILAAVVAGALALGACSSSSKQSAPPSAPATTATTAPPAPNCGDPVASFAPTSPLPPPDQMPAGSFMEQIRKKGHLTAAVSADTLLFGFRNPITGNIEGFDIDVVHRIAQAIFGDPNKVAFKVVSYAQRIPSLDDKSADIVADVMTINCTRWQQISFSSQYFQAGQKVLVRTDSKATGMHDLNGQRVCVAKGSTNFDNMKNYPKVIPVGVDDISDCMVLFQQGSVEAVTADDTVLAGFVEQDPYAKIVGPAITVEPYGLGIAKGHPEFVQFVNNVLQQMRTDGTWKQLYVKWLKPKDGVAPEPPPAKYGRAQQ
jgi:polar amino acid transport system substrate-binding protein